jgi:GntR family transcriptional regulator, transcriptional repressor for pyruvate dehydrogenase complex
MKQASPTSGTVRSVSIVDAIESRVKEMIVTGVLKPGEQLPSERELQESLGVSRLPLREALARLQALGLIRIRHGKGAFVEENVSHEALRDVLIALFPERNAGRLRELVEARGLLEGEISALVSKNATDDELQQLDTLLESGPDVVKDAELFANLDYAFHHQLATLARNSFLLLMHEALGPHIRSFIMSFARTTEDRQRAHARNIALLQAVKSRNSATAAQMARDHLQPCLKVMVKDVGALDRTSA